MNCKFCTNVSGSLAPEWCETPSANNYFLVELPGINGPLGTVFCEAHAMRALATFTSIKEISKEEYEALQVVGA